MPFFEIWDTLSVSFIKTPDVVKKMKDVLFAYKKDKLEVEVVIKAIKYAIMLHQKISRE